MPDDVAGGGDVLDAGMRGDAAARVDHRHLTHVAAGVLGQQHLQRVRRAGARAHQIEPVLAVARIDERLRGDRADAGLGPRHDRTDAEPVRLHGDAQLSRRRIARNDRIGVDRTPRCSVRLQPDLLRRAARACDEHERESHLDRLHLASISTPPVILAATLKSAAWISVITNAMQP